jgi:hypothetical protein
MIGDFRVRHGAHTDHPHERPDHLWIWIYDQDGKAKRREKIPAHQHPGPLFLPIFAPATILSGETGPASPDDASFRLWCLVNTGGRPESTFEHEVGFDLLIDVLAFTRMLAKIGHAYAVAELGLENFRPLVTEFIRGEAEDFWRYIGTDVVAPRRAPSSEPIDLRLGHRRTASGTWLVAGIRIFADFGTPKYHVVVGELESREQVFRLTQNPFHR